jgi:hypothetical protein
LLKFRSLFRSRLRSASYLFYRDITTCALQLIFYCIMMTEILMPILIRSVSKLMLAADEVFCGCSRALQSQWTNDPRAFEARFPHQRISIMLS